MGEFFCLTLRQGRKAFVKAENNCDIVVTTVIAEGNMRKYPAMIEARSDSVTTAAIPVPGPGVYNLKIKIEDGVFSLTEGRGEVHVIGTGKPVITYETNEKPTPKNTKIPIDKKYDAQTLKKLIKSIELTSSSVNHIQDLEKILLEWFPGNYYGSVSDIPGGEIKESISKILKQLQKQIIGQFIIFIGKIDEEFTNYRQIRLGSAALFIYTLEAVPDFVSIALSAIIQKKNTIPLTSMLLRVKNLTALDTLLCSDIRDKKIQGSSICEIIGNVKYPSISKHFYNRLIEDATKSLDYCPVVKKPSPWTSLKIAENQTKSVKPKNIIKRPETPPAPVKTEHINKYEVFQAEEAEKRAPLNKNKKFVSIEQLQTQPASSSKTNSIYSMILKPSFPEPDVGPDLEESSSESEDVLEPESEIIEEEPVSDDIEPASDPVEPSEPAVVTIETPVQQKKPIGLVGGMIAISAVFMAFAAPKLLQMLPSAFEKGAQ